MLYLNTKRILLNLFCLFVFSTQQNSALQSCHESDVEETHRQIKARRLEGALTKSRVFQIFEIEWIDVKNVFNLTVHLDEKRVNLKFENWNLGSHKILFFKFPLLKLTIKEWQNLKFRKSL